MGFWGGVKITYASTKRFKLHHVFHLPGWFFFSTHQFGLTLRILSQEDQQLYSTFLRMAVESVSWSMVVGKTVGLKGERFFFSKTSLKNVVFPHRGVWICQNYVVYVFFSKKWKHVIYRCISFVSQPFTYRLKNMIHPGLVFLGGCRVVHPFFLGGWFCDHRFFGKALTIITSRTWNDIS